MHLRNLFPDLWNGPKEVFSPERQERESQLCGKPAMLP